LPALNELGRLRRITERILWEETNGFQLIFRYFALGLADARKITGEVERAFAS
jgi:hypothetical protein